jgi:hypothetical protein
LDECIFRLPIIKDKNWCPYKKREGGNNLTYVVYQLLAFLVVSVLFNTILHTKLLSLIADEEMEGYITQGCRAT